MKIKREDLPNDLKDVPSKYIHKRYCDGKVKYFFNRAQKIRDINERNRKKFKEERGYESP